MASRTGAGLNIAGAFYRTINIERHSMTMPAQPSLLRAGVYFEHPLKGADPAIREPESESALMPSGAVLIRIYGFTVRIYVFGKSENSSDFRNYESAFMGSQCGFMCAGSLKMLTISETMNPHLCGDGDPSLDFA